MVWWAAASAPGPLQIQGSGRGRAPQTRLETSSRPRSLSWHHDLTAAALCAWREGTVRAVDLLEGGEARVVSEEQVAEYAERINAQVGCARRGSSGVAGRRDGRDSARLLPHQAPGPHRLCSARFCRSSGGETGAAHGPLQHCAACGWPLAGDTVGVGAKRQSDQEAPTQRLAHGACAAVRHRQVSCARGH